MEYSMDKKEKERMPQTRDESRRETHHFNQNTDKKPYSFCLQNKKNNQPRSSIHFK